MESAERKKTALAVIGGVLNFICGVTGIIGGFIFAIFLENLLVAPLHRFNIIFFVRYIIFVLIPGAIAIYGGLCAIRKEKFGWAIGGGICALLSFSILGLPGLILVIVARAEFK